MKKYIVQLWNRIEIEKRTKEDAEEVVRSLEDGEKYRDFKIFEVTEERKEV